MGIRFHCPNGHKLNVKSFLAGKKGVCPDCGVKLRIPDRSEPGLDSGIDEEKQAVGAPPAPVTSGAQGAAAVGAPVATRTAPAPIIPSTPAPVAARPAMPAYVPQPAAVAATVQPLAPPGYSPVSVAAGLGPGGVSPATVAPPGMARQYAMPVAPGPLPAVPVAPGAIAPGAIAPGAIAPGAIAPGAVARAPVPPPPPPPMGGPPAPHDPIAENPLATWFVRPPSGGQFGPARGEVMRKWLTEGRVTSDSLVWREGWTDWLPATEVFPSLGKPAAPLFGVQPAAKSTSSAPIAKKSNGTMGAAILVFLAVICLLLVGVLAVVLSGGFSGT